jgi:hypothetical protein
MDFADRIQELAERVAKQIDYCTTEEATKNALVLPFIQALGYDVFNPAEVMPELTADIGIKKGEKVDYAISVGGEPVIAMECKRANTNLTDVHASQLYRYFTVLPSVRFGVLTNGVTYLFYSDLEAPNRMDDRPFFAFDVLDYQEREVGELKKFTKSAFNLIEILETAGELKYTAALTRIISEEFESPSDDFVKFLARQVYSGNMTQKAVEQFAPMTRKALRRFLNERISERLKSALEVTGKEQAADEQAPTVVVEEVELPDGVVREDRERGIVTTEEEIEAYFVVKSILREHMDVSRLHLRDAKSYCNVLLDDSNRKPIFRMHFDLTQNQIGLFDHEKHEERIEIESPDEIYQYGDRLLATVQWYDSKFGVPAKPKTKVDKTSTDTKVYTGKSVQAFSFEGQRFEVGSWRELLLGLVEQLRIRDQMLFEKTALQMKGRKRPYFTKNPAELREAYQVNGTELYVEVNLSSQMIANICYELAERMGYSADDLVYETD